MGVIIFGAIFIICLIAVEAFFNAIGV